MYTARTRDRIATHLHLDEIILLAVGNYVIFHLGNQAYWNKTCKPYIALLPEHLKFAQFSSRCLKHYTAYIRKISLKYPRRSPRTQRALAFFVLVDRWYYRDYA